MSKAFMRWCGALLLLLSMQAYGSEVESAEQSKLPFSVKSQNALAFLQLDLENNPGRMFSIQAGYQWNLFRNVGYTINGIGTHKKDYIIHRPAASIALGYNFGDKLPVTLGLKVGVGGGGNMNTYTSFSSGGTDYDVMGRQKIRSCVMDLALDYEFKSCSKFTPFVGVTGGAALLGNRGKIEIRDAATGTLIDKGAYGKRQRINLAGGAQIGGKYQINDRVMVSLTGNYVYAGRVPGEAYHNMTLLTARTNKVRVHELALKAGLKIVF